MLPLAAGLAAAIVGSTRWCNDSLYDGLGEFIGVLVLVVLLTGGWGMLAGAVSLRSRRGLALLGAIAGGAAGLTWCFTAFAIGLVAGPSC